MAEIKIGFAGRWSPLDKKAWSGTYYHTYHAIKKQHDTELFFYQWPWHVRESLLLHKLLQKCMHRKAAVEFLYGYAKYFSRQLEKDLVKRRVDILFVPSAPQLIAYCKTSIPIIYLTDATFFQLNGYYPSFSSMASYNCRQGIHMDKLSFEKAAHCLVASSWVKDSAVSDYGISPEKISVAPFGANLDMIPQQAALKKEKNKICQLLFLGVDWERKGGQIALDTFYSLQNSGMAVQLTIIGCVPPVPVVNKDIKVIPFINKNNDKEATLLYTIFRNCDFLLLPSRAECAGVVFSEASAFGVPSITTDTGGVSTYVQNGVNGFTLPLSATASEYAGKIRELFCDDETYKKLCIGSREKFETELNWDKWGKTFYNIAENILNN